MTCAVTPHLYNQLPTLQEAEDKVKRVTTKSIPFENLLNGPIRDVFLKHGCEKAFCAFLQHAHHHLEEGEAIVKVNDTGHLMNQQAMNDLVLASNKIVPTTWMVTIDGIAPMELAAVYSE
ncbi:3-hydroxybutyryl- dehydratase [Fusarium albosuccineum]|uniref:3-hydroxybutyryl- dehydratase n=1 Tax=Fusarium albosuccineum TaxID=1237068 RepID=A0A8H4KB11_9HYPO|nr:3-hydroxybutyryl- dehydratase [Fusarium albosuccineum]